MSIARLSLSRVDHGSVGDKESEVKEVRTSSLMTGAPMVLTRCMESWRRKTINSKDGIWNELEYVQTLKDLLKTPRMTPA